MLNPGDNLTVDSVSEDNFSCLLVDDSGGKWRLHCAGYHELYEEMYVELLTIYGSLEHRDGLKHRNELVTRDERKAIKRVLDAASLYR